MDQELEAKIVARGKSFFASISGEAPSVFDKSWWTGKIMDWAMQNEHFKVQLFRFVDVLPYLTTSDALLRHIREYFTGDDMELPAALKMGANAAGIGGGLGGGIAGKLMGATIRSQIETMGRQFIVGSNAKEAIKGLSRLRKDGFAFTVDLLGEAAVSEQESEAYAQGYHEILDAISKEYGQWKVLPGQGPLAEGDWGATPRVNVSIKPSALFSQARAVAPEEAVEHMYARLAPLYRKIIAMNGMLCIDMEQRAYHEMTIALYKKLRASDEFRHYPHLCIVLQAYLVDIQDSVEALVHWARSEELPIAVRLVKGAYWDYETVMAKQAGWPVPVWTYKAESDIAYEKAARTLLEQHEWVYFACASHNVRSIAAVMETAMELGVPAHRYEFQVLYGMAEPVRKGLLHEASRVRLYCPYGELIPGMAYLVRRLLENTANESFLRQSFAEGTALEILLENPQQTLVREQAKRQQAAHDKEVRAQQYRPAPEGELAPFRNEPLLDVTIAGHRRQFVEAIARVRASAGRTLPLYVNGQYVHSESMLPTVNPAQPDEILAQVCQADTSHIDTAIAAAQQALPGWRTTPAAERAHLLQKVAGLARQRIFDLAALQVLEVGKQWDQAYHDVGEGIDFLEYYAREMLRLATPKRMGHAPGECNHMFYQPKGIAAVIAPWNFPFAIAMGMVSAALVTGNPVIFKPSSIASAVGYSLVELFHEAGLPAGVFAYCPGKSAVMGDYLVEHPHISLICFTGSMDVGLHIVEKAAKMQPGQQQVKRVIAEMGGKNATIIDDDADLDEAVVQVLSSAFGFQGQKCSACSRVIVLDAIYEKFCRRLCEAAQSLPIGPAENPAYAMGPVADAASQQRVLEYIALAEQEGTVLVKRTDLPEQGYYVPLLIVEGITPAHRIAQEEIFGPVLAVMRAKDFDDALAIAASTRFALTGAVFSRSPEHLEKARQDFRVGNLYLNRGCTGAMVERQPFGGFMLSGAGAKTGSPDYLLQFMDSRVVTENTMRRGFAPIAADDDWIA